MATTIERFGQAALTATLTTNLAGPVPASTKWILKEIVVANTAAATRTVTIRAGGTGVANTLLPAVDVPANTTVVFSLSTIIPTGEYITGGADTGGDVGVTLSGVAVT